jgi:hypothetical protein
MLPASKPGRILIGTLDTLEATALSGRFLGGVRQATCCSIRVGRSWRSASMRRASSLPTRSQSWSFNGYDGSGAALVSGTGVLVSQAGWSNRTRPAWMDRVGRQVGAISEAATCRVSRFRQTSGAYYVGL